MAPASVPWRDRHPDSWVLQVEAAAFLEAAVCAPKVRAGRQWCGHHEEIHQKVDAQFSPVCREHQVMNGEAGKGAVLCSASNEGLACCIDGLATMSVCRQCVCPHMKIEHAHITDNLVC